MKIDLRPTTLRGAKKKLSSNAQEALLFNPPLRDSEIIKIQSLFMTPSIQCLKTKNISTGRALINTFLYSLNHYQQIGCLSTSEIQSRSNTLNIYQMATENNQGHSLATTIENLCTEISFIDFAWIELTKKLQQQISNSQLQNICENLSAHEQIPVMVICYEDE